MPPTKAGDGVHAALSTDSVTLSARTTISFISLINCKDVADWVFWFH